MLRVKIMEHKPLAIVKNLNITKARALSHPVMLRIIPVLPEFPLCSRRILFIGGNNSLYLWKSWHQSEVIFTSGRKTSFF